MRLAHTARLIADVLAIRTGILVGAEQRLEAAARLEGRVDQSHGTDTGNAANRGCAADGRRRNRATKALEPYQPL